jgi:hypothetical protein
MTTSLPRVIVQVVRDGAVDRYLREEPPPSVTGGRVVVEHLVAGATGELELPEAGEVVLSVLSPEVLRREQQEVRDVVQRTEHTDEPLVIIVEAAEWLREDELGVVLDAAERAGRLVILRILANA